MPLGTAGPIKKAEKLIGREEPFLVLNGDIFADLNYKRMFESHVEGKAVATIALHQVEDPSRFGVAEMGEDNRIARFIEKPPQGTAPSNLINAGVYVLSPRIFDYIPTGRAVSMEREVFPKLAQEKALYGREVNGLWIDIGKPEEYLETNKILLDRLGKKAVARKGSKFKVENPVAFDRKVTVEDESVIGPYAVVGRDVSIGKNVQIRNSVIFSGAKIGDCAVIEGALVGEGAVIGKGAQIGEGCIVADQAKVKDGVVFSEKISVCPGKEASEETLKSKNRSIC